MDRTKVAVYTAIVVLICALNAALVPRWLAAHELDLLDGSLQSAAALLAGRPPSSPVDATALGGVRGRTVDLTVLEGDRVASTSLPAQQAEAIARAAPSSGRTVDAGSLASAPGGPWLPLLLVNAPAYRVRAVPAPGGNQVLAAPVGPALAPLATYQWISLAAAVLLLLIGVGVALKGEAGAVVPRELLQAADRIGRGEFSARAPALAGSLGVVSSALNRAAASAEAAQAQAAPVEADPFASLNEPAAAAPVPPARTPPPAALGRPPAVPAAGPGPESRPVPPGEAARIAVPSGRAATEAGEPAPTAAMTLVMDSEPGAAAATVSRAVAVPGSPAEDEHWRAIHQDFLRVRAECGEAANVPFERFRQKLEKNRDQLMAKYGCRTVRFQVYVKDGKAALKATPVR